MEWPVLGRDRAATRKRSVEKEPGPSKKPRKKQGHWNMKLAMISTKLPEVVEKLIEEYAFQEKFRKFFASYGPQRALYNGRGFVSDWHPRIASTTRDRYIWIAFCSAMSVYGTWNETMGVAVAKPLEGRMVLIVYRNRRGNITRMDPKRVVIAAHERMQVDCGPNTTAGAFNVYYSGVISIDLYVDVARSASDR